MAEKQDAALSFRESLKNVASVLEQLRSQENTSEFRETLKDTIVVLEKLSPHSASIEEVIGMVNLALENDGQVKLLMTTVMAQGKR